MDVRSRRFFRVAALAGLVSIAGLAGCSRYYQVTDATWGDVYYTDSFSEQAYEESGQATFVDVQTGATVTLVDVEVRKVGRKSAFNARVATADDD